MNFKKILTSSYTFTADEYELKLKYILFNSLLVFNIIFVGIATLTRILQSQYTQAVFDSIYLIVALFIFFLARSSKEKFNTLINAIIFLSFLVVTLTFYSGFSAFAGISWYIILVITVFFLKGRKEGEVIFLISLMSILTISIFKHQYILTETILTIVPLIVTLFFMLFFEQRNNNLKEQLLSLNASLQQNNNELNSSLTYKNKELIKLQQVLDKSPVSIIITDTNGNIEYANPWFEKLTGYSTKEFIGENPNILKSDLHSDSYYKELWNDITNGKVWNGTFKNISKSGKEYWEAAIIAPVNSEKGELSNFIAIKQEITQQVYLEDQLVQENKDKLENFEKTLESFVQMVEERDTYTAGHSHRIAEYSKLIAQEMNYSEEECELLYRASILHDIGKIATPDNVLLKPGKLSQLEYRLIQEHVRAGYEILSRIPMYKDLAEIIISHHERYDGNGYPYGLKGDEIHPLSQIMIVADAFDAMTTNRIYKGRKNAEEALVELQECSKTQFHPNVVQSAIKALSHVELHDTINQLPKTDLEKERFSYFYRDQVTNVYNADYLKFILNQNHFNKEYICINVIYMHNFSKYNNKYGWSKGDDLLSKFADYLIKKFPSTQIFRIYGDDFVLISKKHLNIDIQQFEDLDTLREHHITVTYHHTDLRINNITDLEELQH